MPTAMPLDYSTTTSFSRVKTAPNLRCFDLKFLDYTMMQEQPIFCRNHFLNFDLFSGWWYVVWYWAVISHLTMLGSGIKLQLPGSQAVMRVNNWYTYARSVLTQPFRSSPSVHYSINTWDAQHLLWNGLWVRWFCPTLSNSECSEHV